MATILNNAAYMALPMNIKRGNPIPLDTTAVWYDKRNQKLMLRVAPPPMLAKF